MIFRLGILVLMWFVNVKFDFEHIDGGRKRKVKKKVPIREEQWGKGHVVTGCSDGVMTRKFKEFDAEEEAIGKVYRN